MEELRGRWTHLYKDHLPALAKAKDPVQDRWPVWLDHCFARIILDNAVGKSQPWTDVVKAPAVKHMSESQLQAAIRLGERIATGQANLVVLDQHSLELRGKKTKRKAGKTADACSPPSKKTQQASQTISKYFMPSPASPQKHHPPTERPRTEVEGKPDQGQQVDINANGEEVDIPLQLKRIADSNITVFRKQTLSLLCQVPRGRYSTYQAMSDHITKSSHKTCARAVGNAMRNNPFAPEVPCHRILAADGSLGGFCGDWGENGKFADKKHKLLHEEGVRFDSRGKVKGPPFREFT